MDNKGLYENLEDAEFITPPNKIKKKVGSGGIPEVLLQRAQEAIDDNYDVDFLPYATKYLESIDEALLKIGKAKTQADLKPIKKEISESIMHLKANGGMFGYHLISMVSDVALNFADTEKNINADFIQIITAHNNSIRIILENKIKGSGGMAGDELINELRQAVQRFDKKYNSI